MTAEDPQNENTSAHEDTPASAGEPTLPEAPALNREQRRAQAQGKKGVPSPPHASNNAGNRTGGARPANAGISNKIPRTGHK